MIFKGIIMVLYIILNISLILTFGLARKRFSLCIFAYVTLVHIRVCLFCSIGVNLISILSTKSHVIRRAPFFIICFKASPIVKARTCTKFYLYKK